MHLDARSLICLRSTAQVDGETVSRIVGRLPEGSVVATPRHHTGVVVTEYGAAELTGLTVRERAHALVISPTLISGSAYGQSPTNWGATSSSSGSRRAGGPHGRRHRERWWLLAHAGPYVVSARRSRWERDFGRR